MKPIRRELLNGLFVLVVASLIGAVFVEILAQFATELSASRGKDVRPRHAAAIALAVSAFATFSCGSQSHQQEAPPGESAVTSPKRTQANPGTATCAGGCPLEGIGLYDSAPGCYVGIIPEMKSYAAPSAGQRWEDSPKEGPPFPEAKAEVCFESAQFGMQLHTVNVTTASPEWNSFFDEGRLDLLTKGYGLDSTVDLQIEGYLGGAATWANLEWTCKTTIPDHRRLLCKHRWMRHTGPELDAGS
ncbi:hypothetical protein [Candidatus Binatus sp.]|jgi:hypothetical protein|uniref:hypothetical protein n=1 Tax=Candidatus Binatus sp. TaxID=2811406 RepID=UPI003C9C135E